MDVVVVAGSTGLVLVSKRQKPLIREKALSVMIPPVARMSKVS